MAVKVGHGAAGSAQPSQNSDINVTPFIDVLLVLLIIFMVALPPPTVDNNINMPPQSLNPPPPDPNNQPLFVSLNQDLTVTLSMGLDASAAPVKLDSVDQIPGEVAVLVPQNRGTKETYIRADFDVSYSNVMGMLNRLRESGLKKIGLVGEATS